MMRLCIAGQLALMPASVAILAPGVNAFRRLRKNLTEPVFNSWGYNTRSAALRIPCSDESNRRIEYRLAGADANPYLVAATILTGMLYGLENIDEGIYLNRSTMNPNCRCSSRRRLRPLPAVSISPTAWATPFPNSGSPASFLNSTGLSAL
jgi:glutamine synthetase